MLSPSCWSLAPLRLLRGPPEQLAEVVDGRGELAVGGQGRQVDIGLGAGDGFVVEARQPGGDRLDLVVEPVVGHRAVDVPVPLGAGPVEVVGDEQDLEGAPAAYQSRKPRHRAARRDDADTHLPLAQQGALARGEPQVTGEHELASGAASAAADRRRC